MKKIILSSLVLFNLSVQSASVVAEENQTAIEGYPHRPFEHFDSYQCELEGKNRQGSALAQAFYLCVSKSLSPHAINIIRQSFVSLADGATDEKVIQCSQEGTEVSAQNWIYRYFVVPLQSEVGPAGFLVPRYVFISASAALERGVMTFAYDHFYDDRRYRNDEDRLGKHLSLAINQSAIDSVDFGFRSEVRYWASAFARVVVRNMGITQTSRSQEIQMADRFARCIYWKGLIPHVFAK